METAVALCQLNPVSKKPEINFKKVESVLATYEGKNISLFVFPEYFLYGILRVKKDLRVAGKNFRFWVKRFCSLARKYDLDLVPGSFPLFKKGKLYNTTVYIDRKGNVLNQYSKTNLWLSEREDYDINPDPPKVFNSILGKTVQIICWDLMDHHLFEEAVRLKAEWMINVSLWTTNQTGDLMRKRGRAKKRYPISQSSKSLDSIIETRSTEYNIGIVFCNIGGSHNYITLDQSTEQARSAGSTQIVAPLDCVRKIVKNRKEQVLICKVPKIKNHLSDHEIFYGRREDVKNNYPYITMNKKHIR